MTPPVHRLEGEILPGAAAAVSEFLAANAGKVEVLVNSPGGDATEGAAICAALESRAADVTARIEGIAASAASLAVMGAGRIVMHPAALMMIHEPHAWTQGTGDDMRKTAADLDKFSKVYAEAYARATGHPVDRIAAWMKAETWLTAEEALELNFCDAIEGGAAAEPLARFDYSRFRAVPPELLRAARANGWVPAAPDAGKMEKPDAA